MILVVKRQGRKTIQGQGFNPTASHVSQRQHEKITGMLKGMGFLTHSFVPHSTKADISRGLGQVMAPA